MKTQIINLKDYRKEDTERRDLGSLAQVRALPIMLEKKVDSFIKYLNQQGDNHANNLADYLSRMEQILLVYVELKNDDPNFADRINSHTKKLLVTINNLYQVCRNQDEKNTSKTL